MATQAVFSTHELLENILMHLTFNDLYIDQRVCKKWQQVIIQSVTLQEEMFTLARDQTGPIEVRLASGVRLDSGCLPWYDAPLSYNPLVRVVISKADPIVQRKRLKATTWPSHPLFEGKRLLDVEFRNSRYLKGMTEAMAKAMYLTQPPITELNEVIVTEATTPIRRAAGITLDDFAVFKRRCSKHTSVNLWHKEGTVDVEDRQPPGNANEVQAGLVPDLVIFSVSLVLSTLPFYFFGTTRITFVRSVLCTYAGQLLYTIFWLRRLAWFEGCVLACGMLVMLTAE